jgi:acyl transferase domain-containing protein
VVRLADLVVQERIRHDAAIQHAEGRTAAGDVAGAQTGEQAAYWHKRTADMIEKASPDVRREVRYAWARFEARKKRQAKT